MSFRSVQGDCKRAFLLPVGRCVQWTDPPSWTRGECIAHALLCSRPWHMRVPAMYSNMAHARDCNVVFLNMTHARNCNVVFSNMAHARNCNVVFWYMVHAHDCNVVYSYMAYSLFLTNQNAVLPFERSQVPSRSWLCPTLVLGFDIGG